jgi:hypothetical protein
MTEEMDGRSSVLAAGPLLEPGEVAGVVAAGLAEERFLILPASRGGGVRAPPGRRPRPLAGPACGGPAPGWAGRERTAAGGAGECRVWWLAVEPLSGVAAGAGSGAGVPGLLGLLLVMEAGVPVPVPGDLVLLLLGDPVRPAAGPACLLLGLGRAAPEPAAARSPGGGA